MSNRGGYFEWHTNGVLSASTKYYSAGGARVAMRQMGVVTYLFGDHLNSTSVAWDDAADTARRQGYTAFGTERYRLGGELPTRYQFTGQRGFEEIGLQYYGARWYDGALGRFSQADTLIPEPGNPMAWDRYAYARNSPTMYTDPTGHAYCPSNTPGAMCVDDEPDPVIYPTEANTLPTSLTAEANQPSSSSNIISSWFWNNIPSAMGIHFGVSGQIGIFAELAFTPGELLLLINLYSGEITLFGSMESYGYLGTPNLLGGNIYGGNTLIYGLSENGNFVGPSLFAGVTGSIDSFAQGGASLIGGRALEVESAARGDILPQFFIDPISNRSIEYHQASVVVGLNAGANAVDLGGVGGMSNTAPIWNFRIPFWPKW